MTLRRTALLLTAGVLTLSGCSGGGSTSEPAGPTDSAGTSAGSTTGPTSPESSPGSPTSPEPAVTTITSPTQPSRSSLHVPKGVHLTPEGTHLRLGRTAVVAWKPEPKTVGFLRITVDKLERADIGAFHAYTLDRHVRRSTPFFVRMTVRNVGRSNLSGVTVPLYLLDSRRTLIQPSSFHTRFRPCGSRPLPKHFTHDARTGTCQVYFAPDHGRLRAMVFRPTRSFDAITWSGRVTRP